MLWHAGRHFRLRTPTDRIEARRKNTMPGVNYRIGLCAAGGRRCGGGESRRVLLEEARDRGKNFERTVQTQSGIEAARQLFRAY